MMHNTVGFAMCGSFCTHEQVLRELPALCTTFETVIPILSEISAATDTRFGTSKDLWQTLLRLCGRAPIATIQEAEPIGPKKLLDLLIVAPCTGNTLGKLACGITDSAVTMAVKAQLRNERPVLLAVSTNDGLAASGKHIMELMNRKHLFFVPFGQDDPVKKRTSLQARMPLLRDAALAALRGEQLEPVLVEF